MGSDVFLNAITCGVGDLIPIESFPELSEAREGLDFNGLKAISTFKEAPFDRLGACISQSLKDAAITPDDIDAVVFTTGNSNWSETLDRRLLVTLDALGLSHAQVRVSGGFSCGNTSLALANAQSLLRAGEADMVLFASLDFIPDGQTRLTPPDIAVDADGTSAAVLGRKCLGTGPHYRIAGFSSSFLFDIISTSKNQETILRHGNRRMKQFQMMFQQVIVII